MKLAADIRAVVRDVEKGRISEDAAVVRLVHISALYSEHRNRELHEDIKALQGAIQASNCAVNQLQKHTPRLVERLFGRVCMVNLDTVKVG